MQESGRGMALSTKTNVGAKMMKAMGWEEGAGLGAERQGRLAPINALAEGGRKTDGNATAGLGQAQRWRGHRPR